MKYPLHKSSRFRSEVGPALIMLIVLIVANSCFGAEIISPIETANQEFLRQQEREKALRQKQEQTPDVMQLEIGQPSVIFNRLPTKEFPCFPIKRILLVGEEAKKFKWAIAAANFTQDGKRDRAINRCLGTQGINLVMRRIQNAIIKRGYITTRVVAGPQNLSSGILKLTLIPGRINNIRYASKKDAYHVTYRNALPILPKDLLNLRDIEQGLENFKRVPTAEADIQITPAKNVDAKPGESDLIIKWKQGFPLRFGFSADDSGTRATGKYLGNATVSYDNFWALNDLFYINLNHELGGKDPGKRGTHGYTAHYSLPFGYWTLGFTTTNNIYHQAITRINQTSIYSGESWNNEIKLSRLIYRNAVRKITLALSGWERSSKNFQDDTEIPLQRRRMAGWEFGINHREFIGPSILDVNLSYRKGTGALNALAAPEEAFNEGTSRPKIILANLNLNVPFMLIKQRLHYIGSWKAQWNKTPLIQQDRFSIGGRYTVRGFTGENLLSADRGWLIRNDLGVFLGKTNQEFYVGIDHGEVGGSNSQNLIGKRLSGGVFGLRGGYKWFTYDLFIGKPLRKPSGFITSSYVTGFNISFSF